VALPLVHAAVRVLAEMATFDTAGVTGPEGDPAPVPAANQE
jgi:NaMN:DMB phosphoribosyltransferase